VSGPFERPPTPPGEPTRRSNRRSGEDEAGAEPGRERQDERDAGTRGKPLGRGLEQISHLFISGQPGSGEPAANPSGIKPPRPESVLLRHRENVTREQLTRLLSDHVAGLEPQLRAIDTRLPCSPYGEIDLIACDSGHQITIVDFELVPDDRLLLRGLSHIVWVARNMSLLRRTYREIPFDTALPPRLVLVAPGFSALFLSAARQNIASEISCLVFQAVDVYGSIGVLFTPAGADGFVGSE